MLLNEAQDIVSQELADIDAHLTTVRQQETFKGRDLMLETNEEIKFALRLQLRTLQHIRRGAEEAYAALLSAFSPVNRISDEILSYIFQLGAARPPEWFQNGIEDLDAKGFTLLIAQVCRRWRRIAVGTPCLWTYLTFDDINLCEFPTERLWLQRSKRCVLDVLIDGDVRNKAMTTILDILLPHFRRVRTFFLMLPKYKPLQTTINRFPRTTPALENLALAFDDHSRYTHPPEYSSRTRFLINGAPMLRYARLKAIHVVWSTFPFANLEALHLSCHSDDVRPTWEEFTELMQAIPRLRTLKICKSGPRFLSSAPGSAGLTQPIILPITKFSFSDDNPFVATEMFKRFLFPNVKFVSLSMEVPPQSSKMVDALREGSSLASAEVLTLQGDLCRLPLVTDEMVADSFGFPNVTNLHLLLSRSILDALANERQFCFPRLEKFTTYHVSGTEIREMLETRLGLHDLQPPRYVRVIHSDYTSQDDLDWLKEFVEDIRIRGLSNTEVEDDENTDYSL